MKRSLDVLNDILIASPCSADWNRMAGDERVRHCGECRQSVYDLSEMTADQAATLLTSGDHVCVRLYRRADGTVLTQDCPVGRAARVRRAARRATFAVASLLGLAALIGCKKDENDPPRETMGKPSRSSMMGEAATTPEMGKPMPLKELDKPQLPPNARPVNDK